MASRQDLYAARRYGATIVDAPSSVQQNYSSGPTSYDPLSANDLQVTGKEIGMRENLVRFYGQRLDSIRSAIRQREGEKKRDAGTYRRAELARYEGYQATERKALQALYDRLGSSQFAAASSLAPKSHRSDRLHRRDYTDAQGVYRPPNPAGRQGAPYRQQVISSQASAQQQVYARARNDEEQTLRASRTPGTYRLSNGDVLVSSLQANNGRVMISEKPRTVYGFNLFDPSTRDAIRANAADYRTAGALFAAAQNPSRPPVPPASPKQRVIERKPLYFEPAVSRAGAFLEEAGAQGVKAYQSLPPRTRYNPGLALLQSSGNKPQQYLFGALQGLGRQLKNEPRKTVAETVAYGYSGKLAGEISGIVTNRIATKYGTKAAVNAERSLGILGTGTVAYQVGTSTPQQIGGLLPSLVAGGVGFGKGYTRYAGSGLDYGSVRVGKPGYVGESKGAGYGMYARGKVRVSMQEFGIPRSTDVNVLLSGQGRESLPTGRYNVRYNLNADPFTFRGATVRPAAQAFDGTYSPRSRQTRINLPQDRIYLSRPGRGKYSATVIDGSARYDRFPLQYVIYDTPRSLRGRSVRIFDSGQANTQEASFGFNRATLNNDGRRFIAPKNRPEYLLSRPSGVKGGNTGVAFESLIGRTRRLPLRAGPTDEYLLRIAGYEEVPRGISLLRNRRGMTRLSNLEPETVFEPSGYRQRSLFKYTPPLGLPSFAGERAAGFFPIPAFGGKTRTPSMTITQQLPRLSPSALRIPKTQLRPEVINLPKQNIITTQKPRLSTTPKLSSIRIPGPALTPGLFDIVPRGPFGLGKPALPFVAGSVGSGIAGSGGAKRGYRYAPDLVSLAFNIRRKKGKRGGFLGIENRPIIG